MTQALKLLTGALLLFTASIVNAQVGAIAGGGIDGSSHDARNWFGNNSRQTCIFCHAPHNTSTQGPLWSHASTTATYTLYASSTMTATPGQPGSISKLCLSCHDGTVAINNYAGGSGGLKFSAGDTAYIGIDLSNDHPVGITYNAASAASNGKLADPTTKSVTIGSSVSKSGTITAMMLVDGKVECTSCHDVHNRYTVQTNSGRGLVKVNLAGSTLCLQCHNK